MSVDLCEVGRSDRSSTFYTSITEENGNMQVIDLADMTIKCCFVIALFWQAIILVSSVALYVITAILTWDTSYAPEELWYDGLFVCL